MPKRNKFRDNSSSCSNFCSNFCSNSSKSDEGKVRQTFVKARIESGEKKKGCTETLCVPTGFIKTERCTKKDVTSEINSQLEIELQKQINVLQAESSAIGQNTATHDARKIAKLQSNVASQIVNAKIDSVVSTALNTCDKSPKDIQEILNNDLEQILTAQGSANQVSELAEDAIILGCPAATCPPLNGNTGGTGGTGTGTIGSVCAGDEHTCVYEIPFIGSFRICLPSAIFSTCPPVPTLF